MAAITTLMTLVKAGEHVVLSRNVYGGTYRFMTQVLSRYAVESSWVDTTDLRNVEAAWRPQTRMLYVETPTNPMMEVTDLRAAAELAHRRDAVLAVDNTFMSPYFQRPLELGADVVVHSTTKFLNGHSDSIGGALVAQRPEHSEWFAFVQKSVRRHPLAVRLVPGAARHQDARRCAWSATSETAARSPSTWRGTRR